MHLNNLPVFTNGSRRFIVDAERYADPQYFHNIAHLIDLDTRAKLGVPFRAIDGLWDFFVKHYSEYLLG